MHANEVIKQSSSTREVARSDGQSMRVHWKASTNRFPCGYRTTSYGVRVRTRSLTEASGPWILRRVVQELHAYAGRVFAGAGTYNVDPQSLTLAPLQSDLPESTLNAQGSCASGQPAGDWMLDSRCPPLLDASSFDCLCIVDRHSFCSGDFAIGIKTQQIYCC